MSQFTSLELEELEEYIDNQLYDMPHIEINEYYNNKRFIIEISTIPIFPFDINQPYFTDNINIYKKQGWYYIEYKQYYPKTQPNVTEQLYEIEDMDDVFNILDNIFDTLRPRDEY